MEHHFLTDLFTEKSILRWDPLLAKTQNFKAVLVPFSDRYEHFSEWRQTKLFAVPICHQFAALIAMCWCHLCKVACLQPSRLLKNTRFLFSENNLRFFSLWKSHSNVLEILGTGSCKVAMIQSFVCFIIRSRLIICDIKVTISPVSTDISFKKLLTIFT